jgi:PAS domain S-box-containing protein
METVAAGEGGTVLIVDGDDQALGALKRQLGAEFEVIAAASGAAALEVLRARPVDAVVTEQRLPGATGAELLAEARRLQPDASRLILTTGADLPAAVAAVQADDLVFFLPKPCETDRLLNALRAAAGRARRLRDERSQARARRAAEASYRDIFDNAPEGIFQTSPDGHFLDVNPAMARIYGYDSPADMITTVGSGIGHRVHVSPESRARFMHLLETGGVVERFEAPNHRKDGSIIWTRTNARAVRDAAGAVLYFEGFVMDITARRAAEEALRESEARYRRLFEDAVLGIFQSSLDDKPLTVNPAFARMFGYASASEPVPWPSPVGIITAPAAPSFPASSIRPATATAGAVITTSSGANGNSLRRPTVATPSISP